MAFGQSFCHRPPHSSPGLPVFGCCRAMAGTDYPRRVCFTLEESKCLWKDSVGHAIVIPEHARGQWERGSIWPSWALLLMYVIPFRPKNVACLIVKMINFYYNKGNRKKKVLIVSFLLMCSYLITHFPYSRSISELTKFVKIFIYHILIWFYTIRDRNSEEILFFYYLSTFWRLIKSNLREDMQHLHKHIYIVSNGTRQHILAFFLLCKVLKVWFKKKSQHAYFFY